MRTREPGAPSEQMLEEALLHIHCDPSVVDAALALEDIKPVGRRLRQVGGDAEHRSIVARQLDLPFTQALIVNQANST